MRVWIADCGKKRSLSGAKARLFNKKMQAKDVKLRLLGLETHPKDGKWFRYRAAAIIVEDRCVLFAGNANEDFLYSIGGYEVVSGNYLVDKELLTVYQRHMN